MITCYRLESIYDHKGMMRSDYLPETQWYDNVVDKHVNLRSAYYEFEFDMTSKHKCAFNSIEDLKKFVNKKEIKRFTSKKYGFRLFKLQVNGLQKTQTIFKECDVITKVDITDKYLCGTV